MTIGFSAYGLSARPLGYDRATATQFDTLKRMLAALEARGVRSAIFGAVANLGAPRAQASPRAG